MIGVPSRSVYRETLLPLRSEMKECIVSATVDLRDENSSARSFGMTLKCWVIDLVS